MIIRQAIAADIHKVARLWRKLISEITPLQECNSDLWKDGTLKLMKTGSYTVIVADDNGTIAGFIDYALMDEPAINGKLAFSRHWYVEPEYRGGTVARDLYEYGTNHAKNYGASRYRFLSGEGQLDMWKSRGHKVIQYLMEKEL